MKTIDPSASSPTELAAKHALDGAAEWVAEVQRRLADQALGDRMGDLLDGLLRHLKVSAGRSDVVVKVQGETGVLPPGTASVIGLIVAEAVFDAVKYAVVGRFGGRAEWQAAPGQRRPCTASDRA